MRDLGSLPALVGRGQNSAPPSLQSPCSACPARPPRISCPFPPLLGHPHSPPPKRSHSAQPQGAGNLQQQYRQLHLHRGSYAGRLMGLARGGRRKGPSRAQPLSSVLARRALSFFFSCGASLCLLKKWCSTWARPRLYVLYVRAGFIKQQTQGFKNWRVHIHRTLNLCWCTQGRADLLGCKLSAKMAIQ